MNFFTDSLDLPQKLQRRCLSLAIGPDSWWETPAPGPMYRAPRLHNLTILRRERSGVAIFDLGPVLDDLVDDAVLLRLVGAHEPVAVHVLGDTVDCLAGVLGQNLVQPLACVQDFLGLDFD